MHKKNQFPIKAAAFTLLACGLGLLLWLNLNADELSTAHNESGTVISDDDSEDEIITKKRVANAGSTNTRAGKLDRWKERPTPKPSDRTYSKEEARELLLRALRSLDFKKGVACLDPKGGVSLKFKIVNGVPCVRTFLGPTSGFIHNANGDWLFAKNTAFKLEYLNAQSAGLAEFIGSSPSIQDLGNDESDYFAFENEASHTAYVVKDVPVSMIARIVEAMDSSVMRDLIPSGTTSASLATRVPASYIYEIDSSTQSIRSVTAVDLSNRVVQASSFTFAKGNTAAVEDREFELPAGYKVTSVASRAELTKKLMPLVKKRKQPGKP